MIVKQVSWLDIMWPHNDLLGECLIGRWGDTSAGLAMIWPHTDLLFECLAYLEMGTHFSLFAMMWPHTELAVLLVYMERPDRILDFWSYTDCLWQHCGIISSYNNLHKASFLDLWPYIDFLGCFKIGRPARWLALWFVWGGRSMCLLSSKTVTDIMICTWSNQQSV